MMPEPSNSQRVHDYLLQLHGADPFASVREASNMHRQSHGPNCGVYPSDPLKMRVLGTVVRAMAAQQILEIGCGLGYSALWLADARGFEGVVDTIDRFPEHIELAERYTADAGYAGRVHFHTGEAADILQSLSGPYDFIHDDGWFAEEPAYFERMVELLRPGGLLAMSNWFLLEDAITGKPQTDWPPFAGPDWAEKIKAYAARLIAHPTLYVSFVMHPWIALAHKRVSTRHDNP